MRFLFVSLLLLTSLMGCYRMPTCDDYSVIPMVNNKDFNQEGENPLMPNMPTMGY